MNKFNIYVILLALLLSSRAFSCSFPFETYESKINSAESIFIGTVLEGRFVDAKTSNDELDESYVEVKVKVHRVIKGKSVPKVLTIKTSPGNCGISFAILGSYLIFKPPGIDYVEVAGGTSEIGRLHEEKIAEEIEAVIKRSATE